jgi:hypothetical protein
MPATAYQPGKTAFRRSCAPLKRRVQRRLSNKFSAGRRHTTATAPCLCRPPLGGRPRRPRQTHDEAVFLKQIQHGSAHTTATAPRSCRPPLGGRPRCPRQMHSKAVFLKQIQCGSAHTTATAPRSCSLPLGRRPRRPRLKHAKRVYQTNSARVGATQRPPPPAYAACL